MSKIREKFDNFFQSGKSGKNRGFQAQSGKKFANQGIFSSLPKLFLLIMFSLAWAGLGFQDSSPCQGQASHAFNLPSWRC